MRDPGDPLRRPPYRSLSIDSIERTSLLAQLRKEAASGAHGFYDESHWENLRVAEGLGDRRRGWRPSWASACGSARRVEAIDVAAGGCGVTLAAASRSVPRW